jgi:hypothetical protein
MNDDPLRSEAARPPPVEDDRLAPRKEGKVRIGRLSTRDGTYESWVDSTVA